MIEASPDMRRDSEKEWYYGNKDKERLGPFSYEEVRRHWIFSSINPKQYIHVHE